MSDLSHFTQLLMAPLAFNVQLETCLRDSTYIINPSQMEQCIHVAFMSYITLYITFWQTDWAHWFAKVNLFVDDFWHVCQILLWLSLIPIERCFSQQIMHLTHNYISGCCVHHENTKIMCIGIQDLTINKYCSNFK